MGVGVVVVGQVASTPSCFPFQKEVNFSKSILSFFFIGMQQDLFGTR
jgi:hypothetical protein